MIDILLAQPALCAFPVFVSILFFWALWTGQTNPHSAGGNNPAPRGDTSDYRLRPEMRPDSSNRINPVLSWVGRIPPALRSLHASCSADYDVKFNRIGNKIRRPGT